MGHRDVGEQSVDEQSAVRERAAWRSGKLLRPRAAAPRMSPPNPNDQGVAAAGSKVTDLSISFQSARVWCVSVTWVIQENS
jgi:hypothetical protein